MNDENYSPTEDSGTAAVPSGSNRISDGEATKRSESASPQLPLNEDMQPEMLWIKQEHHVESPPPHHGEDSNGLMDTNGTQAEVKVERSPEEGPGEEGSQYECGVCCRKFNKKANMLSHQCGRWRSVRPPPYTCLHCGKVFHKARFYKSHLRRHSDEKPFACDKCGKEFKYKSSAIRHCIWDTLERKYKCADCSKAFRTPSQLESHNRIHSGVKPFQCAHCGRKFTQYCNMEKHVQTKHTRPKRLDCAVCGKRFPRPSRLKYHMRVHSDNKHPFRCDLCDRPYAHKQTIVNHYKKKHPNMEYIALATDAELAQKAWRELEIKSKEVLIIPDKEDEVIGDEIWNDDEVISEQKQCDEPVVIVRPELVIVTDSKDDSDY